MKNKEKFLLLVLFFLVASFLFVILTNKNNREELNKVEIKYLDKVDTILIDEIKSVDEITGKNGKYLEFLITGSAVSDDVGYKIVLEKEDGSDIPEKYIKVYLTEVDGDTEKESRINNDVVPTYDEIKTTTNGLDKVLYQGYIQAGEVSYGKKFRLRIWLSSLQSEITSNDLLNAKSFKASVKLVKFDS